MQSVKLRRISADFFVIVRRVKGAKQFTQGEGECFMQMTKSSSDKTWESVLEVLSQNGRLSRFYKTPQHELQAILKLYGVGAARELGISERTLYRNLKEYNIQ